MFPPLRLRSALTLGGLTPREAIIRTWKRLSENEIYTRAAAVSFYAMLAFVPFLALVLTLLVRLLPDVTGRSGRRVGIGNMTVEQLRATLRTLFPTEAYDVVAEQIARIQKEPPVGLLSIGLLVAAWTASSLFLAVMDALNRIYGVNETRSWLRLRLTAIVMTFLEAAIFLAALIAVVAGPEILAWLGVHGHSATLALALQWLGLALMVLLSFAVAFYVGPDTDQRWEWLTPGSLVGTLVFLAATLLFRVYIQGFAHYDRAYGSLGGVMVLLFWFWVSSLVVLAAGQLNKVIEDASPLGKSVGQKVDPTTVPDLEAIAPTPMGPA